MFLTFSPTSALSLNFFFQAEDGIRDADVTGVQTCALPISSSTRFQRLYQWTLSAASAQNRWGSLRHRAYTCSCVLGIASRLRAIVRSARRRYLVQVLHVRAHCTVNPLHLRVRRLDDVVLVRGVGAAAVAERSEEHTSELQSRPHLVCRLLLEKKKHQQVVAPGVLATREQARS